MSDLYDTPELNEYHATNDAFDAEVAAQVLAHNPDAINDELTEDEIKFVLDSVIDFLEPLRLSGEALSHAGQLLRDVEALRGKF